MERNCAESLENPWIKLVCYENVKGLVIQIPQFHMKYIPFPSQQVLSISRT